MRQWFAAFILLIAPTYACALEPGEVFVVYNRNVARSQELARYYASVRKIPAGNLIGVAASGEERISREDYVRTIQEPVKRILLRPDRLTRVKCVVVVRGVPLAINPVRADAERKALREAEKELTAAQARLVALENKLQSTEGEATEALRKQIVEADSKVKDLSLQREKAKEALREKTHETNASVDSELALMFWPEYELKRWCPNPLRTLLVPGAQPARDLTLMTARIDAESFEGAKALIDRAVAVEKTGAEGVAYFDARGLQVKERSNGAYAIYDEAIRPPAELERAHGIKTVLNNEPGLFEPGSCPDAVLYCGWYSLTKYVDAFDWAPGAVGYHVASGEAISLRKGEYWCRGMINDGITATLGPVNEPYLAAFPDPRAFFGLLLTGRYTLAEVYAQTSPWTSWMMTLIGDPLYNPYKANPKMTLDEVKAVLAEPLIPPPQADTPPDGKP